MSYAVVRCTQIPFISWFFLLLLVVAANIVYAVPSMQGLQATSTSDSISLAWSNNIPSDNVYATVTLAGQMQTCEKDKSCLMQFADLAPGTDYKYSIKLVDTSTNEQIIESADVKTLPLLIINKIDANASENSVDFKWDNAFAADDLAAITSSVAINNVSVQCNAAVSCNASIAHLQPNSSYLYTISTLDPLAKITYSTSGVVKTLAYPDLHISLEDQDERCSATDCTDVIHYSVTGGTDPYTVRFKSSDPEVIAEKQFSNSTWVVQLHKNTAYVLEFSATDGHGTAGSAQIKIHSGV